MANQNLINLLEPAYDKCKNYLTTCKGQCAWIPHQGYVPNGFGGAKGELTEVELVIITSEPSSPIDSANYDGLSQSEMVNKSMQILESALIEEGVARKGQMSSKFHKNLRKILNMCWENEDLEMQLKKTWLTNTVLCPNHENFSTKHGKAVIEACMKRYLRLQLHLFKGAFILVLGDEAKKRMENNKFEYCGFGPDPLVRGESKDAELKWQYAADKFKIFRQQKLSGSE